MSWQVINTILGLAAVDQDFWQQLRLDPEVVLQKYGFDLSPKEQKVFEHIHTDDIHEFSQYVLDQLHRDQRDL